MALAWVGIRRTVSRKSLTVILIVSAFVISLHAIFEWPFHLPGGFHYFESVPAWMHPGREKDRPSLWKHTLTPDGLLVTNTSGPHPIFQLIRDAEAAWEEKQAKASKTFDEAVAEYRRRYRRSPPLGFDKWWDYVVKHHVRLPDEYDQIYEDLEPFWGINPHELALIQQEYEHEMGDAVVTVEKVKAQSGFEVVHSTLPPYAPHLLARVKDIFALVSEVGHDLPSLRITLSPHDNPDMMSSWEAKTMALEAAANGITLRRADLPPVKGRGWIQGCPPDSPARRNPSVYPPSSTSLPPSSPKTFIASHRDAMDPCMHPSLLTTHGQFLRFEIGPLPKQTFIPRFSLCSTLLHHDIRSPMPYEWNFSEDLDEDGLREGLEVGAFEGDVPWDYKTNEKVDWRGRTTGIRSSPDTWWIYSHRQRLVALTNSLEGNVSVLPVPGNGFKRGFEAEEIPVGEPESVPLAWINPAWMDVAFSGKPLACDQETCDEMERMWPFLEKQDRHEEGQYKFILDVDGNGWSGRFKRLITSNALIFKATVYPEWYTERIAPWVHYVPIQVNYADLYDTVAFFREHDELGRRIARAGSAWSRRYWRKADMTAYLYRLLLEYARVMSLDREAMSYMG